MKAALFHHNLNSIGGESSVSIETIQSLHELGYDVHLNTIQKPNLQEISKTYGKNIPISDITSLFPFKINYFGVYQRLFEYISSFEPKDADIIVSTNGGFLPYNIPKKIPIITYIHFLPSLITSSLYPNNKYAKSYKWRLYIRPYQNIATKIVGKTLSKSSICITNSNFTDNALRKVYPNIKSIVIYPPVNVDKFFTAYRSDSRDCQVIVISRLSPEKQIEKAIKIAKKLLANNIKFKIMGSLIPSNISYFNFLNQMIIDMKVINNVELIPNANFHEMLKLMAQSKVYLHTMPGDHFGVSIIESMASGLVPVVPSFGGCSEIVEPEYQYDNLEEAARCILNNIESYDVRTKETFHGKSKQFSTFEFRKKVSNCIEQAQTKK